MPCAGLELHVTVHPARAAPRGALPGEGERQAPLAVLVHGSLDRGDSFRRVVRRLDDITTVTYDRRGYQRSREAGPPVGVAGHVNDLVGLLGALRHRYPTVTLTCVGHSLGGLVALGAALERPDLVAAVGAYEPPLPWLGFRRRARRPGRAQDPGAQAEAFFGRMVGPQAWQRLAPAERTSRRLDGPALATELDSLDDAPFDLTALSVPVVLGRGGPASAPHHREGTAWLAKRLAGAELIEVEAAGHGAHLSHPGAFAELVRAVVRRAAPSEEATG